MPVDARSQESLVSVVIATYNRSLYLKQAVESAVKQTYQNIEIIVSDDCSTESPQAIIEAFQDPRIRFRCNVANVGICLNNVNAFKEARGKYVASLNDDDLWNEDFLEKLVPRLDADPTLALAFCDHYIVDSDGKIDVPATEENTRRWKREQLKEGIHKPFFETALVDQAVASAAAAVIRKDVIEWDNFTQEAGIFWDLYVNYLACRSGHGAYYYPERLTRYRVHEQSVTEAGGKQDPQVKIRKAKASIFCYARFMEDERLQEFRPYFKQQWTKAMTSLGIGLMRAEQLTEARPYFLCALRQKKFNLRTLVALILSFTPQPLASRF